MFIEIDLQLSSLRPILDLRSEVRALTHFHFEARVHIQAPGTRHQARLFLILFIQAAPGTKIVPFKKRWTSLTPSPPGTHTGSIIWSWQQMNFVNLQWNFKVQNNCIYKATQSLSLLGFGQIGSLTSDCLLSEIRGLTFFISRTGVHIYVHKYREFSSVHQFSQPLVCT